MAKQLLGKEVTAALNEKIKANSCCFKRKGHQPNTWVLIRVGENQEAIFLTKEEQPNVVRHWG